MLDTKAKIFFRIDTSHELRISRNIPGLECESRVWDPFLSAQTGTVELPTQV